MPVPEVDVHALLGSLLVWKELQNLLKHSPNDSHLNQLAARTRLIIKKNGFDGEAI